MTREHLDFLDNLLVSGTTTVGEMRTAVQAKFDLDRTVARAVIMEWLRQYKRK